MFNINANLVIDSGNPDKGNLYVGGYGSLEQITQYKIGAVLSAIQIHNQFKKEVAHLEIAADDSPQYNMSIYFNQSVDFIKTHLQTTNVLVHCAAGISRSVCLVIAYYVREKKKQPLEALAEIKQKRACAGPNEGFMAQLEKYYKELYKK